MPLVRLATACERWRRRQFAILFVSDRSVLDIGGDEGEGSRFFRRGESVVGVDSRLDAVRPVSSKCVAGRPGPTAPERLSQLSFYAWNLALRPTLDGDPRAMPSESLRDLYDWDRTLVWHAFTQMAEYEPFLIERAQGCVLTDAEGNEYLDGVSSLWCNIHGHRHPKIDAAIREQLDKVAHVTNLGSSNSTTIRLAKRLVEIVPPGLERVFFSDDGATAVEVAVKMAFQYWRQRTDPRPEKTCYLALGDAYHGDTLGVVSVGGVERFHAMFRPLLFETLRVPSPDTYRTPPGVPSEQLCQFHLDKLDRVLAEHGHRIAAVVIEPLIQAAAGMVMHPPGYLRGVRELTRKHEVLLIVDEVAVGFGRTGKMFACEHEGVSPDLLCLAKGMSGGYLPIAATLATDEIWQAFLGKHVESKTFYHGHTYGGNPLGAAAALACLDIFEEERTLDRVATNAARLADHLARIARRPHVGNVRQRGLIGAIELVRDVARKEPFPWGERRGMRVCDHALKLGVWIRPLGDVIVIMPPLSVTTEQLDRIALAAEEGIARMND
ncbi:MAG: adenosylmethionine--8-amino-7-oxononanoate transaminase [Thermoguttaceae bacterium]